VLNADYPLVYLRGEDHLVVVNPRRAPAGAALPELTGRSASPLEASGVGVREGRIESTGFGYGVFVLS
jgi:maltose alpha-D-glucosyltransferase/alpha-amylase